MNTHTHTHTHTHTQIENRSYTKALVTLNGLVISSVNTGDSNVNLTQVTYLLSVIVNGFGNQTVGPDVSEVQIKINYNAIHL